MTTQQPSAPISIVIPTYRREQVLVDTISFLSQSGPAIREIVVVDQSPIHEPVTDAALTAWHKEGRIVWIRLPAPSITHAMNVGLQVTRSEVVLFVDDDIIPTKDLAVAHARAHAEHGCNIVAGQVLQPGEEALPDTDGENEFCFRSSRMRWIEEFMGGNFSVNREFAIALGGFDENFVHVAYRFEAEFCDRVLATGEKILFEPKAGIRHLKTKSGGTRSYGNHLTTVKPSHAVGAYYYLLRARNISHRSGKVLSRFFRSVRTKHHLMHPWWIPGTLTAEMLGLVWALRLFLRGPRLIGPFANTRKKRG